MTDDLSSPRIWVVYNEKPDGSISELYFDDYDEAHRLALLFGSYPRQHKRVWLAEYERLGSQDYIKLAEEETADD